jgi:hypothetical protein
MAKPKDQVALDRYCQVLREFAGYSGYIQWRRLPSEWLAANLPNIGLRRMHELMAEHVASGGKVDQVEELRQEYVEYGFHYDLRMAIDGRRVYMETVLDQADHVEDCTIWVVNMHDQ